MNNNSTKSLVEELLKKSGWTVNPDGACTASEA